MASYKRTRVVSQDMRTGEFAYLDQLIKDGYNPGLLVLPKNWEPPLRQGPSSLLPIVPIINLSPPNTTDTYPVIIQNLVNIDTGRAVLELFSFSYAGVATYNVDQNIQGIQCNVSIGSVPENVGEFTTGQSCAIAVGISTDNVAQNTSGQNCTAVADASGVMQVILGNINQSVNGQSVTVSQGDVLNGSGWSQGGGWGSNGWGVG